MATVFFQSASELATVRNIFKVGGTPTDPTTITLEITSPANVVNSYTFAAGQIAKNSTGDYQKDITCNESGEWQFQWIGTGTAADVEYGTWTVFDTGLGRLYATTQALKSRLGITDTVDDYELHNACYSSSRWVEQYCERHFWRTATGTVRTFVADDPWCLSLPEFNDLVSVSSLKTDDNNDGTFETTWTTGDYQLQPVNPSAAPETLPYVEILALGSSRLFPYIRTRTQRQDRVEITGVWGWPSVPLAVRQGALILAEETFKLKDAPFGVAGFGAYGVVRVRDNPKVAAMLDPYKRGLGGVG